MKTLIALIAVSLTACATTSEKEAVDYTSMTCQQLGTEISLAQIALGVVADSGIEAASAQRHTNPYGQSSPFMSGFAQGNALGRAAIVAKDRRTALATLKAASREAAARPC